MQAWYNGSIMNKVHTQTAGVRTSNGHRANDAVRTGKRAMPKECVAQDEAAAEVPEVFEMPPVPTRRVFGRVHKTGPAPFVFVDDFADQSE